MRGARNQRGRDGPAHFRRQPTPDHTIVCFLCVACVLLVCCLCVAAVVVVVLLFLLSLLSLLLGCCWVVVGLLLGCGWLGCEFGCGWVVVDCGKNDSHGTSNTKELLKGGIDKSWKRKGGTMKTDDTNPCMATRSDILTRRCPNRRATGLTKLSGNSTSTSRNQTMFSDSKKMSRRLKRQITPRKPTTNIKKLNAEARRIRGGARTRMAGPTNTQHPDE